MHYNFELALRGLRRFPKSTALIVVTVALGIAACMTALTLLHVLSANPLPGRSQNLYLAWVDTVMARPASKAQQAALLAAVGSGVMGPGGYHRVKLGDAEALLSARRATRQAVVADMTANEMSGNGLHAEDQCTILATSSGFIPMFGVPLLYGHDWTRTDDKTHAPVAVIDVSLARGLFGKADAVGQTVRLNHTLFRVIGITRHFEPEPHFYALAAGTFETSENMYVPYTAALDAGLQPSSTDGCDAAWKPSAAASPVEASRHCAMFGLWVQLDTQRQADRYRTFLQNYVDQQRGALAAWGKQPKYALTSVSAWLRENAVVPSSVRVNVWLAAAFLVLCMLNVVGLLTARFLRRDGEIGIRRALGATRSAIFAQHIMESGLMCLSGGLLAIPLTLLGLAVLRRLHSDFAGLARFDPTMLVTLVILSVVVGILAGLVPAWRAAVIEPGLQIKSE